MEDGVDHINIYSKGKTELGKYLSNFTYSPFTHPFDGDFKSIEGYWYYNITGSEYLKELYGFKAKQYGRIAIKQQIENGMDEWEVDKQAVKIAIICKLTQNEPDMLREFLESKLPFKHYYQYGDKVVEPKEGKWIVEFFEDIRKTLQS